ncbi:MAG: hypothetical protein WCX17_03835 [Parcubacteria group bacterium]|jgi:protein tyrosine phosphatase (PTP) superfamily phosphohydrolase (DUF442 family)
MQYIKKYKFYAVLLALILAGFFLFRSHKTIAPQINNESPASEIENISPEAQPSQKSEIPKTEEIFFVGPRGNLPDDAPNDYGFWSLAIPVPGVLSRSGQPTLAGFKWLKDNGWKSDINLRIDGDHSPEISDDSKIPGFNDLDFNYLKIQMLDGAAPTDAQAEQFLSFVTKPENQPSHVHCRGGIGRAGIMVVLYRYAIQGWPLDKAIEESRLFQGGISEGQLKWVTKWTETHPAGSYAK